VYSQPAGIPPLPPLPPLDEDAPLPLPLEPDAVPAPELEPVEDEDAVAPVLPELVPVVEPPWLEPALPDEPLAPTAPALQPAMPSSPTVTIAMTLVRHLAMGSPLLSEQAGWPAGSGQARSRAWRLLRPGARVRLIWPA